jgi:adenine-specific DNA-methyltransferase
MRVTGPSLATALSRQLKIFDYKSLRDPEVFAQLYWLFSREAIAGNSLEKYAEALQDEASGALPSHQMGLFAGGYQSIDDLFLAQLDDYRETLARAFKRDNSDMTGEQLTETVQRTLDRLVFLRFLEDKLIEPERIVQKIAHAKQPWKEFLAQSHRLDGIYNGIVFKPHSLLDQPDFVRDTQDFVSLCTDLSANDSPYDFNHIPVEMLGRIYERFLGKVVTATAKRVQVEDKPDVRRAGGVFYTPDYIVQYMAEQALQPLMAGKKPNELLKVRAIDTSCGSGSFLIGVFDVLLRQLGRLYFADPKLAKAGDWVERDGQWRLSIQKKRELLVSCIHGVDIDAQAVQVAQLSLYLKLMEDETTASAAQGQMEMQEALLPTLNRNIIVGNALISPLDDAPNDEMFAEEMFAQHHAVNLRSTFFQVMQKEGGFDLVIGNPPYIKEYTHREAFDGLRSSPYYQGKMDIWYLFACRGLDLLKPKRGRLALIATNNWTTNAGAKKLRQKIIRDARIEQLIDFADFKVFRDAGIQTMILLAKKDPAPTHYSFDLRRLARKKPSLESAKALLGADLGGMGEMRLVAPIEREKLAAGQALTFAEADSRALLEKIEGARNFIFTAKEVGVGIDVHQDFLNARRHEKLARKLGAGHGIFNLTEAERQDLALNKAEKKLLKPFFTTAQLGRYWGNPQHNLWVIYTDSSFKSPDSMARYPKLKAHLDQFKTVITSDNKPYGLHRARDEKFFVGEKIISARKCAQPTFTYTDFDCYVSQTFNLIKTDRVPLKYLTALLNSKLMRFWLRHQGKMQGRQFQVDKEPLLAMPLCTTDAAREAKIVRLVEHILLTTPQLASAPTDAQAEQIQRSLDNADQAIQAHIYAIYGLDEAEIERVEADK